MPRAHLYPLSTNLKFVFFFDVCATTLWFCCLGRFLILLPLVGRRFLPGGIADFFHVVALIPLIGFFMVKTLVRINLQKHDALTFFNAVKMAWICYGVIFPHPKVAKHTSYSLVIASWCILNFIHFGYHSFKVKTKRSPDWLFWLQYHQHYLTFPAAFTGEIVIIFLSLAFVENNWYELFLKAVLLCYIPVGYLIWGFLSNRSYEKYDVVMEKRRQGRSAQRRLSTQPNEPTPHAAHYTELHNLQDLSTSNSINRP